MNILPKKSICLLLVCVMAVASGIPEGQAQEPPTNYRLVEPTAEDYANEVDAIVALSETPTGEGISALDALADELQWRLIEPGQMPYQPLLQIYRAYAQVEGITRDDSFIPPLLEQWLADHPADLYRIPGLVFDDFEFALRPLGADTGIFSITVRAIPFLGLVSGYTANYIVIQGSADTFQVPALPVSMFGDVIETGDFNTDLQIDVAYLHYDYQSNSYVSGSLVLVTWTGQNFEILSEIPFRHGPNFDPVLTWQFASVDEDWEQELIQTQLLGDNWNCEFIRVTYYDWQADATLGIETSQDTFPESFGCLLRQAEENMWAKHYAEAVEFYNEALAYPVQDESLLPYLNMRLGLAYLFTGQTDVADALFTALSAPDDENYPWVDIVREAYLRDSRLLPVCQAIYAQAINIHSYEITGTTEGSDGSFNRLDPYDPGIDLENLSCDLPSVFRSELESMSFPTTETPMEQFQALGLTVDAIPADLDSDGDEDMIAWPSTIGMDPVLFIANGAEYTATVLDGLGWGDYLDGSADMRAPDAFNQYSIVQLPDGTPAIANLDMGVDLYNQVLCYGQCGGGPSISCADNAYGPEPSRPMGDLTLWRLEGNQLTSFFFAYMCGWAYQPNWVPEGIETGSLVAGDQFPVGEYHDTQVRPVTYIWDESTRTFVAPPQPVLPTATPMPFSPQEQPMSTPLQLLYSIRTAFVQRDFSHVLELSESVLQQEPDDPALIMATHYYRALALEALARPDEALAEYIAIYERAPESAWGRLAGLHLESVE